MKGRIAQAVALFTLASTGCCAQIVIHLAPEASAKPFVFHDDKFHVEFQVPPGWEFTTKDDDVSAFHADVPFAPQQSEVRGVASLNFNPYPRSTLSGAMVYFSVEKKASAGECASQVKPGLGAQKIGGMRFGHGHDEGGQICTEMRDDVYTAYRHGSCYRFDLKVNTFCAVSSGAVEVTDQQLQDIEERMAGVLSTVQLGWEKSGPNPVPAPEATAPRAGPGVPAGPESRPRPAPQGDGQAALR
jgi:hypothetical protein